MPANRNMLENFMRFIAEEVREYMAKLGIRTLNELIGRSDFLKVRDDLAEDERTKRLDLSPVIDNPFINEKKRIFNPKDAYNFELEKTIDEKIFLKKFKNALETGEKTKIAAKVTNIDRALGTILGSEITRKLGDHVADDTFTVECIGSGGQSFGAFIPKGLTLELVGDSNDYFGKGLSGGKLIVYPPEGVQYSAEDNIVIGNVALIWCYQRICLYQRCGR